MSVRTPTFIWAAVTPWSGAPDALPAWQTFVRLPKLADPAAAPADVDFALAVTCAPVEPLRPHPAAISATAARAAMDLICGLTGFLLGAVPGRLVAPQVIGPGHLEHAGTGPVGTEQDPLR